MKLLILNFAKSLRKNYILIIALATSLIIIISLFSGYWLNVQYGNDNVNKINGKFLNTMVTNSESSNLDYSLLNYAKYNNNEKPGDYFFNKNL